MKRTVLTIMLCALSIPAFADHNDPPNNCEHQPGTSRCQERKVYTGDWCQLGSDRRGNEYVYERNCTIFDGCGKPTESYVEPGYGGGCDGMWDD